MKKPRRESEQALYIYAEMVVQAKPLTLAQLVELTDFPHNIVKPCWMLALHAR